MVPRARLLGLRRRDLRRRQRGPGRARPPRRRRPLSLSRPRHVVLVEPEIHWNAGNAGRSCLAAGAQLHLVEPLGFSLDDRQVRRAGLDYWPRVQPRVWESLHSVEEAMRRGDLGEPFLFAPGRGRSLFEVSLPREVALVFGRESDGLPQHLLDRHADRIVHLPMRDPALRSLNLSTTVGIALYEALRQSS